MQAMKRWAIWEAREERKLHADLQQHQPGVLFVDEKRPGPDLGGASVGVLRVPAATTTTTAQQPGRQRAPAPKPSAFAAAAGNADPGAGAAQVAPASGAGGGARQERTGLARAGAAPAPLQEKAMSAPPDLQRLPAPPQLLPGLPEAGLGMSTLVAYYGLNSAHYDMRMHQTFVQQP